MKQDSLSEFNPLSNPFSVSLNDVAIGLPVRVKELCGDPAVCQRLREMGFCEYAEICKVAQSEALICRLHKGKIVLSKRLAENILVEAIAQDRN